MNWIRQTFKYFGLFPSSTPDEQLLKDDFHHHHSSEDLSSRNTDTVTTIKTFTVKYPISTGSDDIYTHNEENLRQETITCVDGDATEIKGHDVIAGTPCENSDVISHARTSRDLDHIELHADDTADLIASINTSHTHTKHVNVEQQKKSKRMKKVRKRVGWAVRRSWKWIKRGFAGYAPGLGTGLMYWSSVPAGLFNTVSRPRG